MFPSEPEHIVANPLYEHITEHIVANPVYASIKILQVNTPGTHTYESPDEVESPAEVFIYSSTGANWSHTSMPSRLDSSPGVEGETYESLEMPRQTRSQSEEPQAYQDPSGGNMIEPVVPQDNLSMQSHE